MPWAVLSTWDLFPPSSKGNKHHGENENFVGWKVIHFLQQYLLPCLVLLHKSQSNLQWKVNINIPILYLRKWYKGATT